MCTTEIRDFGIDLGSNSSGTTSVCFLDQNLSVLTCPKDIDAEQFLHDHVKTKQARRIWIDAPLSLPAAYYEKGDDFFFRQCDKQLGGMSPMFLGGLTARAMRLSRYWQDQQIEVHEVYPAYVGKKIDAKLYRGSGKDLSRYNALLSDRLKQPIQCDNWHEIDAVLCWWIGRSDQKRWIGDPEEGRIAIIPSN